jgi:hypothetical protein
VVAETEISIGNRGGEGKASCPSEETSGESGLPKQLIFKLIPDGKTSGLLVKEWAEIGVIRTTCASGCAIGPPAAKL